LYSDEPVHATPPSQSGNDLTLQTVIADKFDKELLISQQKCDPSWKTARELGSIQQHGYLYIDDLLIHVGNSSVGVPIRQVVLPEPRRLVALHLAHDSDMARHCGVKCTLRTLLNCVIWPIMHRDVTGYVMWRGPCKKQANHSRSKAPLNPFPVIATLFKRAAFDLIGPYL